MAHDSVVAGFEEYLTVEIRLAPLSVATYLTECRIYLSFLETQKKASPCATASDVIEYLLDRQLHGASQPTIAKAISALRSLHQFLLLEGICPENPVALLDAPRLNRPIPRVLSEGEVDRFLSVIDVTTPLGVRDRALFELIYSSGLRVSEAVNLTLEAVFLEQGMVRVVGKGKRERLAPLGKIAQEWLHRYLQESRHQLLSKKTTRRENALFLNWRGTRLSRKGMWKRFREIARRAGLEAKIHTLRHSYATHLLRGGADLRSVQELLGHQDIGTTQIYTHVDDAELAAYHKKFHPRG